MIAIDTERLALRNFGADDWEALYELITQYESSPYAAYDQPWPTSPAEIKKVAEWFASGDNYLAVCLQDTGQFIGFVALNPEQEGREFNLGYVFNSNYHGKGYATEACQAVLSYAFGPLKAQRVITGTAAVNQASCRLLDRLGFRKTAETTASFRSATNGEPIEFHGYTFVNSREEWERR